METGDKNDLQQPVAAAAEKSPATLGGEELLESDIQEGGTQDQGQSLGHAPADDQGVSSTAQSASVWMYQTADRPSVEPVEPEVIPDRSTRPRVSTAKGLEYQQQTRAQALRSAIIKWRRKMDVAEDILADCEDVSILSRHRDELSVSLNEIHTAAVTLSELCKVDEPIDALEDETRQLRKRLNSKKTYLKDEIRSTISRRSKGSSKLSRALTHSS